MPISAYLGLLLSMAGPQPIGDTPSINLLNPQTMVALSPGFTMKVFGNNFQAGDTVTWNGMDLPTTVMGLTELHVDVPASSLSTSGDKTIRVRRGATLSNTLPFSVPGVHLTPASFTMNFGTVKSGSLSSILTSDNSRLVSNLAYIGGRNDPNLQIDIEFNTTATSMQTFDISIETSSNVAGPIERFFLFDNVTNSWYQIHYGFPGPIDRLVDGTVPLGFAHRYLKDGKMKVRLECWPQTVTSRVTYSVDWVHLFIRP